MYPFRHHRNGLTFIIVYPSTEIVVMRLAMVFFAEQRVDVFIDKKPFYRLETGICVPLPMAEVFNFCFSFFVRSPKVCKMLPCFTELLSLVLQYLIL